MTVHPTITFPLRTRNNFKQLLKHILESVDTVDIAARAILLHLLTSCKTKQSEVKFLGIAAKDPTRMTIASALITTLRNYGVFYDVEEDVHTNSILITKVDQPVVPTDDDVDIELLEDNIANGSIETAVNDNDESSVDSRDNETSANDTDSYVEKQTTKPENNQTIFNNTNSEVVDGDEKDVKDDVKDDGFDQVSIQHINTSDNYSNAMAKALGKTLLYYIMGRKLPEYMKDIT